VRPNELKGRALVVGKFAISSGDVVLLADQVGKTLKLVYPLRSTKSWPLCGPPRSSGRPEGALLRHGWRGRIVSHRATDWVTFAVCLQNNPTTGNIDLGRLPEP
jgi:hypothetical protein